jgi:hypothetical protein
MEPAVGYSKENNGKRYPNPKENKKKEDGYATENNKREGN